MIVLKCLPRARAAVHAKPSGISGFKVKSPTASAKDSLKFQLLKTVSEYLYISVYRTCVLKGGV